MILWRWKHAAKYLCPINERWYVSIDLFLCVDIVLVYTALLTLLYDTQQDSSQRFRLKMLFIFRL
jgi:hypothetical protein